MFLLIKKVKFSANKSKQYLYALLGILCRHFSCCAWIVVLCKFQQVTMADMLMVQQSDGDMVGCLLGEMR